VQHSSARFTATVDRSKNRRWWRVPRDTMSTSLVRRELPPTFFGFVYRTSFGSQISISLLAIVVFVLETAPLEMQRRILNAALRDHDIGIVVTLAAAYAGIVTCEGCSSC
jgi:hypothetical protein